MTTDDRATLAALGLEATANRAMHLRGTMTGDEIDAALAVVLRLSQELAMLRAALAALEEPSP